MKFEQLNNKRSIVFAEELDCSFSRTRKLVIKSAAVAATFCPPCGFATSVGINGKNNGVVCADVMQKRHVSKLKLNNETNE